MSEEKMQNSEWHTVGVHVFSQGRRNARLFLSRHTRTGFWMMADHKRYREKGDAMASIMDFVEAWELDIPLPLGNIQKGTRV